MFNFIRKFIGQDSNLLGNDVVRIARAAFSIDAHTCAAGPPQSMAFMHAHLDSDKNLPSTGSEWTTSDRAFNGAITSVSKNKFIDNKRSQRYCSIESSARASDYSVSATEIPFS
jgi:hypothetical protein